MCTRVCVPGALVSGSEPCRADDVKVGTRGVNHPEKEAALRGLEKGGKNLVLRKTDRSSLESIQPLRRCRSEPGRIPSTKNSSLQLYLVRPSPPQHASVTLRTGVWKSGRARQARVAPSRAPFKAPPHEKHTRVTADRDRTLGKVAGAHLFPPPRPTAPRRGGGVVPFVQLQQLPSSTHSGLMTKPPIHLGPATAASTTFSQ